MPNDPLKNLQVPINLEIVKKIQELVINNTEECIKLETADCPASEIAGYLVGILLQEAAFISNKMHISYDMLLIMMESSWKGIMKQKPINLLIDTHDDKVYPLNESIPNLDKDVPEINVKAVKGNN